MFSLKQGLYIFLVFIGAIFTHHAYFPGLMANDSSSQFHQALTLQFDDWHPPIVPLLWSLTHKIIPGPEGLFLLQITLYWGAFLTIGINVIDGLADSIAGYCKYIIACLLPFSPFLINVLGTIWKDVLVFGALGMALGLMLSRPRGSGLWSCRSVVIWALLLIGSLARHNSMVAVVPLLVLNFWPEAPQTRLIWTIALRGAITGILIITTVVAFNRALDNFVFHSTKMHIENSIFVFDLVGISHHLHENVVPGQWSDEENARIVSSCYSPAIWDGLSWYGDCHFVFDHLWGSGVWQQSMIGAWARAVASHPSAYAAHRLDYLRTLTWPQTTFTFTPNKESIEFGFIESNAFKLISNAVSVIKRTFPLYLLLTVAFWLILSFGLAATLLLAYSKRPREYYRPLLVASSAACYAVPLVIIGQAGDYRYVFWAAGATCIAALLSPQGTSIGAVRELVNEAKLSASPR